MKKQRTFAHESKKPKAPDQNSPQTQETAHHVAQKPIHKSTYHPIIHMQRVHGNAYTVRHLRQHQQSTPSVLQRATYYDDGNSGGVRIDGALVATYEDAADLIRESAMLLAEHKDSFKKYNVDIPPKLDPCIDAGIRLIKRFDQHEGDFSDDDLYPLIEWYETFEAVEYDARSSLSYLLERDLRERKKQADDIKAQMAKAEPSLREIQHRYFMADEPDTLMVVGKAIAEYIEWQEKVIDMSLKVETAYDHVKAWRETGTLPLKWAEITGPGKKLFEAASSIKSAYEKFEKFSNTIDLLMPQKTQRQETMGIINLMGILSDLGITFGQADIFQTSLPPTGYPLGPMLEKATELVKQIDASRSKNHNRDMLNAGFYNYVQWDIVPGGKRMFKFMTQVMAASSAKEIPDMSEFVSDYFVNHAESFNRILGGRSEVPVTGVFFQELNTRKIKDWVFKYRKDIWGALYGATKVP